MDASKAPSADGRFLGTVTAAACHDLMNVFATFNQALGLMDDCLAADAKTTRRTFGIKGGFAYRERFVELTAMLRGQLARAVGLTEALALAAHSLDGQGRAAAPPEALAALMALAERLLKRRKITAEVAPCAEAAPSWPPLRRADYLGPVLETLLACLPHLPMGGKICLSCRADGDALAVTLTPGDGEFPDEALAAGLYAARAAGAAEADVAPGKTLTLVFRESPTTQPASCPPQADGAS
ncbi:hypothetical protein [Solidesulfovibrio carbinolicus]|uniref:Histidine kinase n=1 Tax=Solidesulfovibrio carbinolicus TaxID=296842 RepID=A0A4P6HI61_9BACT|nr:hypothetical protein [Solidesulfovibrio carbinolicus]QAZ66196.1 hypothetical protein C3Y92_02650 [Solidesulfovibrio carbinolicus]